MGILVEIIKEGEIKIDNPLKINNCYNIDNDITEYN